MKSPKRQAAEARGRDGERRAAWWLWLRGWRILDQRVRTPAGEVDIVARRGNLVAFVEVKTRRDMEGDPPQAAVNTRKQNRLGKLAQGYLKLKRLRQVSCRFDVVSVIFNDEGAVKAIRHIPNAFSVSAW